MQFDNSYARLPERFYARTKPTPVARPRLIHFNHALADELGIDAELRETGLAAECFSGNRALPGADPIAMAYAGHQFGHFVPQLGDGRAILLGELLDRSGSRRDLHLKGSGPTVFSRRGDGRAALGPVLREYLVSEAMHALGVPTTRALAATLTGEPVYREQGALPGAIITRVALSHVRVGTFEFFPARKDSAAIKILADYALERLYPTLSGRDNVYVALLEAVCERQASLIARWMLVGFIHGVMNTDNMAVSGETIDFGPCAFMDAYDPATVFSSIDHGGRYAFGNQPHIAQWNLARFAETLLPLFDPDQERAIEIAMAVLEQFNESFARHFRLGIRRKLGLFTEEETDAALIQDLLDVMQSSRADFTLTFRALTDRALRRRLPNSPALEKWFSDWSARIAREPRGDRETLMRKTNPLFIPRNHRVEEAITAAIEHADFAPFETLLKILSRPFDDQPEHAAYLDPAPPSERRYQTFCGT